ncbi:hypothetical protein [Blastococcus sp. Marseille-P5729]|uniref:hypothetical protein n=1 Tax=Blastococcus sp. Marseille-P5729 TaxID=2086582 RepID=UPI000D0E8336|nr:hypothetical protein [Blastococcus sp. Marseille-P5729]
MLGGDPRAVPSATTPPRGPRPHPVPDPHTPVDMGPQHAQLASLIRSLATVSQEQDEAIAAAWYELRGSRRFAARGAVSDAASRHGRLDAQLEARQRAWSASTLRCRDAAADAALALVVRDLVGSVVSKDAYDQLTRPWARVMGPVHPDDAPAR